MTLPGHQRALNALRAHQPAEALAFLDWARSAQKRGTAVDYLRFQCTHSNGGALPWQNPSPADLWEITIIAAPGHGIELAARAADFGVTFATTTRLACRQGAELDHAALSLDTRLWPRAVVLAAIGDHLLTNPAPSVDGGMRDVTETVRRVLAAVTAGAFGTVPTPTRTADTFAAFVTDTGGIPELIYLEEDSRDLRIAVTASLTHRHLLQTSAMLNRPNRDVGVDRPRPPAPSDGRAC